MYVFIHDKKLLESTQSLWELIIPALSHLSGFFCLFHLHRVRAAPPAHAHCSKPLSPGPPSPTLPCPAQAWLLPAHLPEKSDSTSHGSSEAHSPYWKLGLISLSPRKIPLSSKEGQDLPKHCFQPTPCKHQTFPEATSFFGLSLCSSSSSPGLCSPDLLQASHDCVSHSAHPLPSFYQMFPPPFPLDPSLKPHPHLQSTPYPKPATSPGLNLKFCGM